MGTDMQMFFPEPVSAAINTLGFSLGSINLGVLMSESGVGLGNRGLALLMASRTDVHHPRYHSIRYQIELVVTSIFKSKGSSTCDCGFRRFTSIGFVSVYSFIVVGTPDSGRQKKRDFDWQEPVLRCNMTVFEGENERAFALLRSFNSITNCRLWMTLWRMQIELPSDMYRLAMKKNKTSKFKIH
jgi:hypothetical protein